MIKWIKGLFSKPVPIPEKTQLRNGYGLFAITFQPDITQLVTEVSHKTDIPRYKVLRVAFMDYLERHHPELLAKQDPIVAVERGVNMARVIDSDIRQSHCGPANRMIGSITKAYPDVSRSDIINAAVKEYVIRHYPELINGIETTT